ncbi:MAG: hypothetical protein JWM19_5314 [Actinomycetia bacterium]|nr:hypothetical protein [Actinomycetes bacterium]
MYHRLSSPAIAAPVLWLLSEGRHGTPEWSPDAQAASRTADYAEANGLAAVVYRKARAAGVQVPAAVLGRLARVHDDDLARAAAAEAWIARIDDAMAGAGIPVVWLKGAAWGGILYAQAGPRPMRDLDFVVAPDATTAAAAVLGRLGFETEPGAPAAPQHLPRFRHGHEGIRVDLHHRLLPRRIYGFDVVEPPLEMAAHRRVGPGASNDEHLFHLLHMYLHVFHHSFYNLRLLHLHDIHLATAAWGVESSAVGAPLRECMPATLATRLERLVAGVLGGQARHPGASQRLVDHFVCNGSLPLWAMLPGARSLAEAGRVAVAESRRARFVLTAAPGRFGRPPAALHPPE